VSDFVKDGVVAMRRAMMKNGGGLMHGMHGSMRGDVPNDETAPVEAVNA